MAGLSSTGGHRASSPQGLPATQNPSRSCNARLASTDPIVVDQAAAPDTLDPAASYSGPGWGAIQQIYQGLVNYNGSVGDFFSPVLAQNWSVSPDGMHWNFTLRSSVTFSNGDPFNAYVQWYSLYRALLLGQGPQFILEQNFFSTNFDPTAPLDYYSNVNNITAANASLLSDLNTWNFTAPTASELALMETPNQSFQVLSAASIELNLGYGYLATGYAYLLATLAEPIAYAMDPAWVDQHGGIVEDFLNPYISTHALGTGPYLIQNYSPVNGGGYGLIPAPAYWGSKVAALEPWNSALRPANTSVRVQLQSSTSAALTALESGTVASASLAAWNSTTISQLRTNPCVIIQPLPAIYGGTQGSWWIYLNQSVFPFNNWSVRAAIAHAVNYSAIIQQAFGGYGSQWVGPVPPGYPYYNPGGLSPYPYDLSLARQEIANSPCSNNACAQLNFSYLYLTTTPEWPQVAQLVATDLAQIGITITPVGLSLTQFYLEEEYGFNGACYSSTSSFGGPFYIGQEFYSSDYFSPDDWTQEDAFSHGIANACMSGFHNATVDNLVFQALGTSQPAILNPDYSEITAAMYANYTDIWLVVPTAVTFYSPFLHGFVQNPMGNVAPAAMLYNTEWAANPPSAHNYSVTFSETGLPAGRNWSVDVNGSLQQAPAPSSVFFHEANGSHSYTVVAPSGYDASPASGTFSVNGSDVVVPISFLLVPTPGGGTGGFPILDWALIAAGVIVASVVVALVVARRRRPPPAASLQEVGSRESPPG